MNGSTPASSSTLTDMKINYTVIRTSWQESEPALRQVRDTVFIQEQHVPAELEWDQYDADSVHFLALNDDQQPVGCIRLLPSGQISRLCVLESLRNQGIGRHLLDCAEEEARSRARAQEDEVAGELRELHRQGLEA